MAFEALPERLAQVRAELARLASQAVTIVAVTKGFGPDAIRAAMDAGLADIGENRVQEAVQKQDALKELAGVRWHLIGHLQRNRIKEEGMWLPTLSMGMSSDYASAVQEGATVIRLGTALFGPREETP